MGAGKYLTPAEMAKIEALTAANWTQRRIAQEIRRDKKASFDHQKRMKTGKEPRKTTRASKLSDCKIGFVIQKAQTDQFSALQITGMINYDSNMQVGVQRIQQIISGAPHKKYLKMIKAPKMTPLNKIDHVEWALKYIKKDHDFWSSVIFCDEKRFSIDGPDDSAYYWADPRMKCATYLPVPKEDKVLWSGRQLVRRQSLNL